MVKNLQVFFNPNSTKYEEVFLYLIIVGYVVTSGLAIPLQVENSRIFAVPYRILIFIFSIFIIFRNFDQRRLLNISSISFFAFWTFYLIKTIYSFNVDFYTPDFLSTSYEIFIRIITIVFFPCVALLLINYKSIRYKKLINAIFLTFFVMLSYNLFYGFFCNGENFFTSIFTMYYISVGHLGASLFIIALFFLLFSEKRSFKWKILFFCALLLSVINVFFVTARSPFLAIILVSLFMILVSKKKKGILIYFASILCCLLIIFYFGRINYENQDFFSRNYRWIFLGDNSLRTPLFQKSFAIFKDNIILGGRTHFEDGTYPHNIFLELLMATGLLGFVLYFLRFFPLLKTIQLFVSEKFNSYYILFFALFLQYFVLVLTSYNLYSVPEFVHFSSIIIGISLTYIYEKTKSNDGRGNTSRNY